MAGCFGNHPFDRMMEQQLNRWLDSQAEFDCDNCEGKTESACCGATIINGDICSECKEHTDNQCFDCEFSPDNLDKYGIQRIYP